MKSYRSRTLQTLLFVLVSLGLFASPAFASGKKAPPARAASQYPAFDSHPDDHVSIAIDPCTRPNDCEFFRLPYIRHSFIPVRVIITNESDTSLDLTEVRMQFISANNDKLPAATLDDLNRRLFSLKEAKGTKIPLTSIPLHHAPVDKKIIADDDDFGFKSTTIAPHSTEAGYLFYDIKDLDDDSNISPLKGAQIYVKMIHTGAGKELFAFSIPFNKALAANPSPSQKDSTKN
ncbi:hypothetical protein [Edaphobacter aggregans]|uniref:hypothetical protein n=1 Tax=Edaphobacter aggregans TaxID=570835 RepID=UPI000556408F|nr:hypothetical protein [Edaphobacter aggregans]